MAYQLSAVGWRKQRRKRSRNSLAAAESRRKKEKWPKKLEKRQLRRKKVAAYGEIGYLSLPAAKALAAIDGYINKQPAKSTAMDEEKIWRNM